MGSAWSVSTPNPLLEIEVAVVRGRGRLQLTGTLGDALMELGQYDGAADAYQKMVSLRPNQSSYNRASYYRWVMGDAEGAIAIMQRAITAGSSAPENTAWCLVDLGNLYFKSGRLAAEAVTARKQARIRRLAARADARNRWDTARAPAPEPGRAPARRRPAARRLAR